MQSSVSLRAAKCYILLWGGTSVYQIGFKWEQIFRVYLFGGSYLQFMSNVLETPGLTLTARGCKPKTMGLELQLVLGLADAWHWEDFTDDKTESNQIKCGHESVLVIQRSSSTRLNLHPPLRHSFIHGYRPEVFVRQTSILAPVFELQCSDAG